MIVKREESVNRLVPGQIPHGLQHRVHGFESRPDFQFIYGHGIKAVPLLRPNNRAFIISQLATESNEVPLRRYFSVSSRNSGRVSFKDMFESNMFGVGTYPTENLRFCLFYMNRARHPVSPCRLQSRSTLWYNTHAPQRRTQSGCA